MNALTNGTVSGAANGRAAAEPLPTRTSASAVVQEVPARVAIIMDGNGRWASGRDEPRIVGHREGARVVRDITEFCREAGVKVLTLYAFSEQNWARPADEVAGLMSLLEDYLDEELPTMRRNGIRLETIGDTARLPAPVRAALHYTMQETAHCRDMVLVLALSYGGREEIVRAAARLARSGRPPETWTEADLEAHLDTAEHGQPDLLVRTGGESRLSNFLLWQASYAELVFTDTPWPDFGRRELAEVFADYATRQRRFGKTPEQIENERRVAAG